MCGDRSRRCCRGVSPPSLRDFRTGRQAAQHHREQETGRPQLFDFNVSTLADAAFMTSVGNGVSGQAARRNLLIWGPHCDIFYYPAVVLV